MWRGLVIMYIVGQLHAHFTPTHMLRTEITMLTTRPALPIIVSGSVIG